MFKPLFEADGYKPVDKKRLPIPDRVHPKDSSFLHRTGKAVKDADGRIIRREGEWVKKQRHTVCGLRDKMAGASSSAKLAKFVNANGHVDRVLDGPAAPCLTPPAPRRVVRIARSSHRKLASRLG